MYNYNIIDSHGDVVSTHHTPIDPQSPLCRKSFALLLDSGYVRIEVDLDSVDDESARKCLGTIGTVIGEIVFEEGLEIFVEGSCGPVDGTANNDEYEDVWVSFLMEHTQSVEAVVLRLGDVGVI